MIELKDPHLDLAVLSNAKLSHYLFDFTLTEKDSKFMLWILKFMNEFKKFSGEDFFLEVFEKYHIQPLLLWHILTKWPLFARLFFSLGGAQGY